MKISAAIQEKLAKLPGRPGVYLMRDRIGRVIYIGKARDLSKRVRSYFQPARFSQLDPKTRALVEIAADIETHEVRNEAESLLLESKLIKEYRPKYNILLRDDKRFPLVKLTRDPFPRFVLTRLRKPDGCRYFGPFSNSRALRNTLDYILKNFHVRTCPPCAPTEQDHRHCHNDVLKYCSAPCVERITPEEYARWVERACEFLEGHDDAALEELEAEMRRAAEKREYERAASLRDTLYDLRATVHQSARKFARDLPHQLDPAEELAALAKEFGLPKPPRVIEGFDIAHIHGQFAVGSMVQFAAGRPAKANYRHFKVTGEARSGSHQSSVISHQLPVISDQSSVSDQPLPVGESLRLNDDCASIQEIVTRRYRRLQTEGKALPDLVLIDGGRGQLNAARLALEKVGVELPTVGLAKEEEEIYLPDRDQPLKLPSGSPALRLLQRIRDESHRFANAFHESWRRKQIRASVLDELPGLGAKRKRALLLKFGSVENMRKATVEQLGEVEGLGGKGAEVLWRYLHPAAEDGQNISADTVSEK